MLEGVCVCGVSASEKKSIVRKRHHKLACQHIQVNFPSTAQTRTSARATETSHRRYTAQTICLRGLILIKYV